MRCAPDGATGSQQPHSFLWRERTHIVADLLATWRLRDRWWLTPSTPEAPAQITPAPQASDRSYYRLACVDGLLCDVYYDAARGHWFLDRVYD
jgi:hypothetical protein